jgi:hypothetical protein
MKPVLSRHQWIVLVAVLIAVALLFVSRSSAAALPVGDGGPPQFAQAQTWPPPPSAPAAASPPARTPTPQTAPTTKPKGADVRLPPTTAQAPPGSAGFSDAFGRFNLALPSGSEPLNATYNLAVPGSGLQVNLSVAPRDEIFRTSLQTFPDMMRNNGALDVGQQQFDFRGRPAPMVRHSAVGQRVHPGRERLAAGQRAGIQRDAGGGHDAGTAQQPATALSRRVQRQGLASIDFGSGASDRSVT